jgi:hypothetical protein
MGAIVNKAIPAATFALLVASAAPAFAAEPVERLKAPVLPGFVVGFEASNATQTIREEVPNGETVERWTRMVTTQRFTGLAARSTPAVYARTIASQLPQACPGATVSPITELTVSRRPAARFQVDCPRNATGQTETFILLAIAGARDMHVKQVAWRGGKSASDLAWASGFLAKTVLCRPRDPQVSCH